LDIARGGHGFWIDPYSGLTSLIISLTLCPPDLHSDKTSDCEKNDYGKNKFPSFKRHLRSPLWLGATGFGQQALASASIMISPRTQDCLDDDRVNVIRPVVYCASAILPVLDLPQKFLLNDQIGPKRPDIASKCFPK